MHIKVDRVEGKIQLTDVEHTSRLLPYPIDISMLLIPDQFTLDEAGVPYQLKPAGYHPTVIAQYALTHWNQYLKTNDEYHRKAFLTQAQWLIDHKSHITEDVAGWPISFSHPDVTTKGPWLSALAQANSISVLVRAYQLTHQEIFVEVARSAVRVFERDILDGGVCSPIGEEGIFLEEVAVYPASHMLSGLIFALFGLYDYLALTGSTQIEKLIHYSLATMHSLLDEFDAGFWTRSDLLHRRLASPTHLTLQVMLLKALATYSGCDHCSALASHWEGYGHGFGTRLRYLITSGCTHLGSAVLSRVRKKFFPKAQGPGCIRVCVPVYGFPVTGGTRAVLAGVAQVMEDQWKMEYLTQHTEPDTEDFIIHQFGNKMAAPWQFPAAWLYVFTGFWKLISLLGRGSDYHIILPQDGVFTAAFAALAAKLAGVRVVCIDHGNLTLLKNQAYRKERIHALTMKNWPRLRVRIARWRYRLYWPSLNLFAWIAIRTIDHFLIPGVAGDSIEESCKRLGVPPSHVTRFASMIDINRYVLPEKISRETFRATKNIPKNAIVIALICRLAPEKGIDVALESISLALSTVSPLLSEQVRVIIAGDGPLHEHVKEEINRRGLANNCMLWGETPTTDVISLLGCSDIFLYTSTRGACFSMAVLEAMAAGCAVVASTEPLSNKYLLAEGRGIAVPPDNAEQTGMALVSLINDLDLCRQMGDLARNYIAVQHSAAVFRRTLMRATYWSGLDSFFHAGAESEG